MKISYNWLKQYLDFDKSVEELSEILTNTGLEVEGISQFCSIEGGLEGIVVGEVMSKEKHPNADRLSLTSVDVGNNNLLSIVCGAPNVAQGQKVLVAMVGTTLYPSEGDSFKIKESKIRGALSQGMICAEDELGLGNDHDGIMVLPEDTKVGSSAAELFEVEQDFVFEIGLTPNRSDAMSHIGVARDIAAAINALESKKLKIKEPVVKEFKVNNALPIEIEIKNKEACPRYTGVVLSELEIKPSPTWMQNRLKSIGIRPINNVVDITNYVLKEFGQPLHAFDYDAIEGNKVIIDTSSKKEKFVTLDGVERELNEADLMIRNANQAMCMAGVFGGLSSGVTDKTSKVFLESAYFNSAYIRRTSTAHGLRTDAAQRYEKGADPHITVQAIHRAIELLVEYANASQSSEIIDVYPSKIKNPIVPLSLKRLESLGGVTIGKAETIRILSDLDIELKESEDKNSDILSFEVPAYRADVLREADLIEEVLRIYGFNNIPIPSTVKSTLSFKKGLDKVAAREKMSEQLTGLGFSEITTNSISKSSYYSAEQASSLVRLQNSMTAELDVMRGSLIPDGLAVIAHNINRKNSDLSLFEFGNIYFSDYKQQERLVLFQSGAYRTKNWVQNGLESGLYALKGVLEGILVSLKLDSGISQAEIDNKYFSYGTSYLKNGKTLAEVGALSAEVRNKFEIDEEVFCVDINWSYILKLIGKTKVTFKEVSKFPKVERDLAIIVKEEVSYESIQQLIKRAGGSMLNDVKLFDVFRSDDKIGKGMKSYAISFSLLNSEKTLTDKEIDKIFNKIMRTLENDIDAKIRK